MLSTARSGVIPNHAAAHYFDKKRTFNIFSLIGLFYSGISNLSIACLRPLPILNRGLQQIQQLPSATVADKVAICTGSNTGIGLETSLALVQRGYGVILAFRSEEKAQQAIQRNKHPIPPRAIIVVGSRVPSQLLLDALFQAQHARVVNLSSAMHHFCHADTHDESYWRRAALFGASEESSYSASKLASLLFSMQLNQRYRSKGLQAIAVNPGAVNSNIWRSKPGWLRRIFKLIYLDNQQGSFTSVAACVVDDLPCDDDALYLQPYHQVSPTSAVWPPVEMRGPFVGYQAVSPRLPRDGSNGQRTAEALWKVSEELTGLE